MDKTKLDKLIDHLAPEEKNIIVNKGTERPFSGSLLENKNSGIYTCKLCGSELFSSSSKFNSHSGWPSFDNALPDAVKENPSYHDVCYHNTGHIEVVKVVYDPQIISYEDLTKYFFEIHDPTQTNGQGPDIGYQYISAIFTSDEEEKEIVEKLIKELESKGYKIATKVFDNTPFWKAEEYHQNYYDKNGHFPYCHRYTKRF